MTSDGFFDVASHWRNQRNAASLVCTPRNAHILAAYQRLGGPEGGPFAGDLAIDQFDEGLPYLYEARPIDEDGEIAFRLIDAEDVLFRLVNGQLDMLIGDLVLGGAEAIWTDSLHTALRKIAPTVARFSLKMAQGAPRQFENLSLPLLEPEGQSVTTLIGSIDEVGAEGPHARSLDWRKVTATRATSTGVAHPVDI